jgi:hypothetical protein
VAVGVGSEAGATLIGALTEAGAAGALDAAAGSRHRSECKVAVKATLPPGSVPGSGSRAYADPALVEALLGWLTDGGWGEVTLLVPGPGGAATATAVGYREELAEDLTAATERFHYGGALGDHPASSAWRAAHVRILVGRARPDPALFYQGAIVSALGCVPDSREVAKRLPSPHDAGICACDVLEVLPVALGVLDAAGTATRVLVSADLLALDWVFGELTGLDGPELNAVVREALQREGPLVLKRRGDLDELSGWSGPSPLRATLATVGAGRPLGALAGAKEVPWTDR